MEGFWEFVFRIGWAGYVVIPLLLIVLVFALRLLKCFLLPRGWLKEDYKTGRRTRDKNDRAILKMFDWF